MFGSAGLWVLDENAACQLTLYMRSDSGDLLLRLLFPRCVLELDKLHDGEQKVLVDFDGHCLDQDRRVFDEYDTVRCCKPLCPYRCENRLTWSLRTATLVASEGWLSSSLPSVGIRVGYRMIGKMPPNNWLSIWIHLQSSDTSLVVGIV